MRSPGGRQSFQLNDAGDRFVALSADPDWPDQAPPWNGRLHPDDVTIDLRIDGRLTS